MDIAIGPETLSQFEDRALYYIVDLTGDLPVELGQGITDADLAARLANDLNMVSEFPRSREYYNSSARGIVLKAVQELEKEGVITVNAVSGPWTISPTLRGRRRVTQWRKEWEQRRQSASNNPFVVRIPQRDAQEAWVEVARLRRELQLAKRSLPSLIADDELRKRCEDLLVAEGHYDRVIREACVILEERVRSVTRSDRQTTGIPLMELAFSPRNAKLRLGNTEQEQLGAMQLYRGTIAFFRNTTGHHLIDTYSQEDALRFVAWVDLLLTMLKMTSDEANCTTPNNP